MAENTSWQLEDFVDSLVVELDKTRETLAVKAVNKPLSYSVKEVALDLNIFPSYDGDQVRFITAQPGQEGASKVSIQLGSITDQQVRATTKLPSRSATDITLDEIDVDTATKRNLRKLGVSSVDDLEALQKRQVDLRTVSDNEIDYSSLANQIQKSRRNRRAPTITSASLTVDPLGRPCLQLAGENLAVDPRFPPVAVVNDELAEVISSSEGALTVQLGRQHRLGDDNELVVTFDPYAVARFRVRA